MTSTSFPSSPAPSFPRPATRPAGGPAVVLGGTGKTGRRVVERLRRRGVPVRAAARSTSPAFAWEDPGSWDDVLAGAGSAYVCFSPDLAVLGAPETVGRLVERATTLGVRRLVLLSGRGEEEAQRAEQLVLSTVPGATVLRAAWFMQNFDEGILADGVRSGVLRLPAGDVPEPLVDVEDIADVAVAALTEDGHAGRVYELTGPALLTFADVASEISRATGRPVDLEPVSVEDYCRAAAAEGVPEGDVELLRYLFAEVMDGRNASVADGVRQALGRKPRAFEAFARRAAAAGAWG